jgi:hypothetical protein
MKPYARPHVHARIFEKDCFAVSIGSIKYYDCVYYWMEDVYENKYDKTK